MSFFPLFVLKCYVLPKVGNSSHPRGSNCLWNSVLSIVKAREQLPVPAVSARSCPHTPATAIGVSAQGRGLQAGFCEPNFCELGRTREQGDLRISKIVLKKFSMENPTHSHKCQPFSLFLIISVQLQTIVNNSEINFQIVHYSGDICNILFHASWISLLGFENILWDGEKMKLNGSPFSFLFFFFSLKKKKKKHQRVRNGVSPNKTSG